MSRRILLAAVLLLSAGLVGGCSTADREATSSDGLHQTAPDVVGMSVEQAGSVLSEAGYEVGAVTGKSGEPASGEATVTSQDPVAGTAVPRGQSIDLVTSE